MTQPDHVETLRRLSPQSDDYAVRFVDTILAAARECGASDLHLQPTADGLDVLWRLDGVLRRVGLFPRGATTDIVARLKVSARLLTYRTDVPQEGRIAGVAGEADVRVCTFPTVFGERAVVRFFAAERRHHFPDELGLPSAAAAAYHSWLEETSGLIIVAGPAGAGKTTTAYAGLRQIVRQANGGRSVVALEDPVEVIVPGVAQSQVNPAAGFDLAGGLKALLRQDPEVLLVGEIRDPSTAETAFQAALTGHLILTTFHAGDTCEALGRLLDMGLEPFALRSGLKGLLCQRLLRKLCVCKHESHADVDRQGLAVETVLLPTGCDECGRSGFQGRCLAAESLPPLEGDLGRAVLERQDVRRLQSLAETAGMTPLAEEARRLVERGIVSPAEYRRVLGRLRVGGTSAI